MNWLKLFALLCGLISSAFANETAIEELPKQEAPAKCSTLSLDSFHPTCEDVEPQPILFRSQNQPSCRTQDKNACGCILSELCEYNLTTSECVSRREACNYKLWDSQECRRAGDHIFYAVGGIICNSKISGGVCEKEETLLAVNFNGKEHTDINSIHHHSGWQTLFEDPDKTRLYANQSQTGVPPEDISLYNTQIYGRYETKKLKCATVRIPYREDGHYELSIKTGQTVSWTRDRDFKFYLNGQPIVAEFKPNLYRKANESMDLNVNFVIHSEGTYLQMTGYESSKLTDPNKMIPFSVCYGSCKWPNVWTSWLLEAISVIKFNRKLSCSVYDNNPCQCLLQEKCDYSSASKMCVDKNDACSKILWNPNLCRRSGDHILYSTGGLICKNSEFRGNCKSDRTILAVNFNGAEHIDINSIHFLTEDAITIEDPDKSRKPYKQRQFGVPEADVDLYSNIIYGHPINGIHTACLAIPIKLAGDGHYEISIKSGQFGKWEVYRDFKYMFNEIPIVEQFFPRRYRENNFAFDLNINFKVIYDESFVKMEGYPLSSIDASKVVKFKLCHGSCPWEPATFDWHIGALSVIKFDQPLGCSDFIDDECGCNHFGNGICEFNLVTRDCNEGSIVCSRPVWDAKQCRRAGPHIFYADGGTICRAYLESGNCKIAKTMLAVNYNGPKHTDIYGIPYFTENEVPLVIPENYRVGIKPGVTGVPIEDNTLYATLVYGGNHPEPSSPSGKCAWVDIPIDGDGRYEVSLKTGQIASETLDRDIAYMLNGQYIVKEFSPRHYRSGLDGIDLNAGFKILNNSTYFKLAGHEASRILNSNNTIRLSYCYGNCTWPNIWRLWHINAFSVVKLETEIACSRFYANPCGCREEGECEYNAVSGQCVDRSVVCNGPGSLKISSECRRGGKHIFYMDAGVLCNNVQVMGDCEVEKSLFAVNFGGEAFVDENGIEYSKDNGSPTSPDKRTGRAIFWNGGLPNALYGTFIYKDASTTTGNGCIKIEIPIKEDGLYELIIKTGELVFNEVKRCFNIWLNHQHIINEFFPALVRLPMNPFDVIVNFRVTNGATFAEISGFPMLNLYNFLLPLEFCPGTCQRTGHQLDHNWLVAAVTVNKFKKLV